LAKYRLTGPDGAKYDVTAPDEATQEEVLSRFQKEVGLAKSPKQSYQNDIDREAARRQRAGGLDAIGPTQATIVDTLSLGAHPQITAAGRVGLRKLGSAFTGENVDFPEEYGRERDVIRAQINQKRAEMGTAATLPMDILGGMAAAPAEAGAAAVSQIPNAISYGRSLWNASKVTGALSAAHGFNVETGDYGDKVVNALEEGAGGMVMGPLIKGGLDLGGKVLGAGRNMLAARKTGRAERANAVAEDFAATGTPEFPPALGGPVTQGTASGLAGTVLGGPIRTRARASLDALEARIRQEIEAAGGGGTPADVGERAKQFLNRQLVQESIPSTDVEGMNPLQLHGISGVPPAPGVEVPPPRVPRVQPRDTGRVSPEDVVQEAVANTPPVPPKPVTDLESRYKPPTPEEVELAPEMVKRVQKASADVGDKQRRLQALTEHKNEAEGRLLNELQDAGFDNIAVLGNQYHFMPKDGRSFGILVDGNGKISPQTPATPEQEALLKKVVYYAQTHQKPSGDAITKATLEHEAAQRERDIVQREMEAFRTSELPKLAEQRRQEALTDATKANEAEASVATQKAREGARSKASADAVQEAMRRTEAARAEEVARAAEATARNQAAANQAHAEDLAAAQARIGEPLNIGGNRGQTYPTEFAAAYRQNELNAPQVRMNPLGARPPVYRAPPQPQRGARYSPAEVNDAVAAWEATQHTPNMPETLTQFIIRQGGIKDTGKEARHIMGGAKARPGLINNKSGRPLDDLGEAAQQAGFFHERPTVSELLDHLDNDLNRGAPVVRVADQDALIALREHGQARQELERVGIAGAKSADEARRMMESQLGPRPPRQRETMAPIRPADEIHATADLLDRLATEAPIGKLKYKAGDLFDENGAVRPDVLSYLRGHLGKRVTDQIAHLSELRGAPGQAFAPGIDKLHSLRTDIGREIRAIRDSRKSGYPGTPRSENDAMLSRLYDALDTDIQAMQRTAGPRGEVAARQREQIDAAYKDYVNNIRAPLAKIFPEKTNPVAAFQELVSATQTGSKKFNTLQAFYKVVDSKGDRAQATSWLLNDMTRDGLPGFLKAYRNLSPDAHRLMSQGEGAPLMQFLDTAARVGGKLERFATTAGDNYAADLSKYARPSNVALGSVAYLFGLPGILSETIGLGLASRLLASKYYAGWLKSFPITRSPTSPELSQHLNRLYAFASQSLGLNKDASQSLKDALVPSKARAGGPTGPASTLPSLKMSEAEAQPWRDRFAGDGADSERNLRDSPWMPAKPDMISRDANQLNPDYLRVVPKTGPLYQYGKPAISQIAAGGPVISGHRPEEDTSSTGSGWIDNLPRIGEAKNEEDLPDSPWMPVRPDFKGRDDNSFKPFAPDYYKYGVPTPSIGDKDFRQKTAMVGENAETADQDALKTAKKMHKGKADRADIWLQTGWTKDPDGKWRSEISDAGSMLTDKAMDAIKSVHDRKDKELTLPMPAVVDHPALYKAYPALKDYTIRFFQRDPLTARNYGGAEDQGININVDTHHGVPSSILTTIRHELQHNIQDEENWPRGGNYGEDSTREEYLRRSREAQARMTEKRQFMNDEQRRARPPWMDYQVPENEIEWKPRKSSAQPETR
jgi:hypothetical protein